MEIKGKLDYFNFLQPQQSIYPVGLHTPLAWLIPLQVLGQDFQEGCEPKGAMTLATWGYTHYALELPFIEIFCCWQLYV